MLPGDWMARLGALAAPPAGPIAGRGDRAGVVPHPGPVVTGRARRDRRQAGEPLVGGPGR
jgi:hypothetical protein